MLSGIFLQGFLYGQGGLDSPRGELRGEGMPYKISKKKGDGYAVTSPHGTKAKGTTKEKAEAQVRLLHGVKHGWKPTGRKKKKGALPI